MTTSEQLTSMTFSTLSNRKIRTAKSSSTLSTTRDSSLTTRFHKLCLEEAVATHNTRQVTNLLSDTTSALNNITSIHPPGNEKRNSKEPCSAMMVPVQGV
jgi:hypothetical protein